jgi:hypothetical protein
MVRVSSKAEIEGIAERVSAMLDGHEKIDLLLGRNADEQLRNVDWNGLSSTISRRLDKTQQTKTYPIGLPSVFKIAAGVAAAAAVLLMIVMIKLEKSADMQLGNRKGSASVEIIEGLSKSQVTVDIAVPDTKLAKCDIRIIDSRGSDKAGDAQAAWMVISRTEPLYADNGLSNDMKDVICLF